MTKIICNYCDEECEEFTDLEEEEQEKKSYVRVGVTRIGSGVNEREFDLHAECAKKFYEYLDKFKKKHAGNRKTAK